MRSCEYCDDGFDDEQAYLRHLGDEHRDELGPIEERRVSEIESDDGRDVVVYASAMGMLAIVGVVAYLVFFTGGGQSQTTPYAPDSVHYHGPINVTIDGQEIDFSRPQYQVQNGHFHFEERKADPWHVHSKGVTLQYAMGTVGIDVTGDTVTFQGTTYRDGESGTNVTVRVNGRSVDPSSYVLQRGDRIRIVVRTNASS